VVRSVVSENMTPISPIPRATYRLQLNHKFTFRQAEQIVPYLSAIGISHCYISPCLKARPGSMHGYDIVDHNSLNPEIGSPEEFDRFVATLREHGMGLIMDIVPNHMAVMGSDNAWWLDVLENGESSSYAGFFDIDWHSQKEELQAKVLVPVLPDHYGAVLESGELKLVFREDAGEFDICFRGNRFPVGPRVYASSATLFGTIGTPNGGAESRSVGISKHHNRIQSPAEPTGIGEQQHSGTDPRQRDSQTTALCPVCAGT
jgi:maltooligosyltrehalose synthase